MVRLGSWALVLAGCGGYPCDFAHEANSRKSFALANVTVVNPTLERLPGRRIQVVDGRVESIDRLAGEPEGPERFVLPGLIDLHVHHPPTFAGAEIRLASLLFLRHGVTTVRDAGSYKGKILRTREEREQGAYPSPRLFACGPVLEGEPSELLGSLIIRNEAEAREAIQRLRRLKPDCLKVYHSLSEEALKTICDEAKDLGVPVVGHLPPSGHTAATCISEVQHLSGSGFALRRPTARAFDFVVSQSRDNQTSHTPTLVVFQQIVAGRDSLSELQRPYGAALPRYLREVLWPSPGFRPNVEEALLEERTRLVGALYEGGIRVLAGTDALSYWVVPGVSLHQELELLEEAGLTAEEAWRSASSWAGQQLSSENLGVIQEGGPADLVVFGRDPTWDLGAMATLQTVIADGRPYSVGELDQAISRYQSCLASPFYDRISGAAARVFSWWSGQNH